MRFRPQAIPFNESMNICLFEQCERQKEIGIGAHTQKQQKNTNKLLVIIMRMFSYLQVNELLLHCTLHMFLYENVI